MDAIEIARSRTKLEQLPFAAPASYWLSLREHDPALTAAKAPQPLLVLHAGHDHQVTEADLQIWEAATAARTDATVKRYPSLKHLLADGKGPSTPDEYEAPATVHKALVDDVADWMLAR